MIGVVLMLFFCLLLPGVFPLGILGVLGVGFFTFAGVPSSPDQIASPPSVSVQQDAQADVSLEQAPILTTEEDLEACHTP